MVSMITTGTDDFAELLLESTVFVDKSLFIKEFLDKGNKVMLITRPRRWGKTINMNMLARFLAIEVDEQGVPLPEEERFNRKLFCGGEVVVSSATGRKKQLEPLNISGNKEIMAEYQGQFPVISIGLKDAKRNSYEEIAAAIKTHIIKLYTQHRYLKKYAIMEEGPLEDSQKEKLQRYFTGSINNEDVYDSLLFLSELLYIHFGQRAYILIDEYDTPINHAYEKFGKQDPDQFKKVLDLFRAIFGAAFKGNTTLKRGLITGILRIAKANLFSDISNILEYTLLDEPFTTCYGFTEEEVIQLMQQAPIAPKLKEVRRWYNGYTFGGKKTKMYNPWSIMNCLENHGHLTYYWMDSGGTVLVDEALMADNIQEDLQELLIRGSIRHSIMKKISFEDIHSSTGLFTLLLFAGYLNPDKETIRDVYELSIPNDEVRYIYEQRLLKWLAKKLQVEDEKMHNLISLLAMGEIKAFEKKLKDLLAVAVSFFQTGEKGAELFYNGFMLCLISVLGDSHTIESEAESGAGRPDVLLIPRAGRGELAFVLEYKITPNAEGLKAMAEKGLAQIIEKGYSAKAKAQPHVKSVLQISIAFCGKEVELAYIQEPTP